MMFMLTASSRWDACRFALPVPRMPQHSCKCNYRRDKTPGIRAFHFVQSSWVPSELHVFPRLDMKFLAICPNMKQTGGLQPGCLPHPCDLPHLQKVRPLYAMYLK